MEPTLMLGDCLDVLRTLPDNSVDSVVTDPPYGLSFMGKKWDYDVPASEVWAECLRVLKPGGHLLAFAGTRTQHRMAVRIEDAGFEIRDMIAWVYGSGFPKSLDVSKAIDKAAGAERKVVGSKLGLPGYHLHPHDGGEALGHGLSSSTYETRLASSQITTPSTEAALQWQGWGTALKPALEPITVARKPFSGPVAANVLAHGTGAINVDGCRVGTSDKLGGGGTSGSTAAHEGYRRPWMDNPEHLAQHAKKCAANVERAESLGRWPANLIHSGEDDAIAGLGEQARFFYCAKASKKDRDEGLEHMEAVHRVNGNKWTDQDYRVTNGERPPSAESGPRKNVHPTVKPTDLMRYLCRLVTPPNGIVLDPFMGSGSTGKAAKLEGFQFIGIEREAEYLEIAKARIEGAGL
jgi:DNA modification methylase